MLRKKDTQIPQVTLLIVEEAEGQRLQEIKDHISRFMDSQFVHIDKGGYSQRFKSVEASFISDYSVYSLPPHDRGFYDVIPNIQRSLFEELLTWETVKEGSFEDIQVGHITLKFLE